VEFVGLTRNSAGNGGGCSVGQCETNHYQICFICREYSALVINDGRIHLAGIHADPGNHR